MTVGKDWIKDAAQEIVTEALDAHLHMGNARLDFYIAIKGIIAKHCPFKPDTAYEPVTICETCRFAGEVNETWRGRQCRLDAEMVSVDGVCLADRSIERNFVPLTVHGRPFGCPAHEAKA